MGKTTTLHVPSPAPTPAPAPPTTHAAGLRLTLLGPLRARALGREIDLGPARQQAILAVLVLRANQVLTPGELLAAVWGHEVPVSGRKLIPTYIYRLRRILAGATGATRATGATGRAGTLAGQTIATVREGYTVRLERDQLDLDAFQRETSAAATDEAGGDHEAAAARLTTALGRWYGEPLAGLPGPYLDAQRKRLTELRLAALERRTELHLRLGRHDTLIPELLAHQAAHPLREHLAALLMTALFQSDRRAEALAVFTRTRTTLVKTLGVEPALELRALHATILRAESQTRRGAR